VEQAGAASDWVAVGRIAGAFGIRGDVKVEPLTDFPERFQRTATLYVGEDHIPHPVASARQHARIVVVHLAGIETATDAEKLRGARLYIPSGELLALPQDQYYLHDLIGLRVEDIDGTALGVVADVLTGGGNDLFVIRPTTGAADVLLPAVKEFVKSVDLAGGVMRVAPIPGLFDDNAVVAEPTAESDDEDETEHDETEHDETEHDETEHDETEHDETGRAPDEPAQ
jgi:16S rRNA processing protein RimM